MINLGSYSEGRIESTSWYDTIENLPSVFHAISNLKVDDCVRKTTDLTTIYIGMLVLANTNKDILKRDIGIIRSIEKKQ
jgi:hypothetical protein